MNSHVQRSVEHICRINVISNILLIGPCMLATPSAFSADSYLDSILFSPNDSMLEAEARGYIMIYDGLDSDTVDRFMDEQFDRIDSAMFVGIRHMQDNGEYLVEDDDCD